MPPKSVESCGQLEHLSRSFATLCAPAHIGASIPQVPKGRNVGRGIWAFADGTARSQQRRSGRAWQAQPSSRPDQASPGPLLVAMPPSLSHSSSPFRRLHMLGLHHLPLPRSPLPSFPLCKSANSHITRHLSLTLRRSSTSPHPSATASRHPPPSGNDSTPLLHAVVIA